MPSSTLTVRNFSLSLSPSLWEQSMGSCAERGNHLHSVAREVDSECWLGDFWRHLFCREVHLPRFVRIAVKAQIFLLGVALRVKLVDAGGRQTPNQRQVESAQTGKRLR